MKRISKKKTKEPESTIPYYTLVIIGENEVGKTQFLHRLNGEEFEEKYFPTFGVDFRIKTLQNEKGNQTNDVQMIDVAGDKDDMHKEILEDIIGTASAFLVVFDLSNEYSVINAVNIKKEFESKIINDDLKRKWYLIGNKKDLEKEGDKVPTQYKEKFDNYFEVSSKTSKASIFDKILNDIILELNLAQKENKHLFNEPEKDNEPFDIDFLEAHGKVFDEECEIF